MRYGKLVQKVLYYLKYARIRTNGERYEKN